MFERDYLIRLITQAAKAIGAVMGLKEQQKKEQALEQIDEFLGKELRMKTRIAMGLSDEGLLAMLSVGGIPNPESTAIIAAFLQEEAELLDDMGRTDESVPRFAKALRLSLYVLRENGEIDGWDLTARIERLLASLAPYVWDAATIRAVWQWRESCGQWASAEDLLYELREQAGIELAEGLAFYDRLAAQGDESLAAGGLPRSELEEGRRQWAAAARTEESNE